MKLYKTKIIIYTDYSPLTLELDDLAHEAMRGDAYCSLKTTEEINTNLDPDWDGSEFFECSQETPPVYDLGWEESPK